MLFTYMYTVDAARTHDDIKDDRKIDIKNEMKAENGKEYNSEDVFIAVFKHIDKERKTFCRKNKIKGKAKDIQWILIVPSIWNERSVNKMKQWIIESGLVDGNMSDQLVTITESDAAALVLQQDMEQVTNIDCKMNNDDDDDGEKKQENDQNVKEISSFALVYPYDHHLVDQDAEYEKYLNTFSNPCDDMSDFEDSDDDEDAEGKKYILVDAGGRFTKISCHRIGANNTHTLLYMIRLPSGGYYIDAQYIKLLNDIFSKKYMDEFKLKQPRDYEELMDNFLKSKHMFDAKFDAFNCLLPTGLVTFLRNKVAKSDDANTIDDLIKKSDKTKLCMHGCFILKMFLFMQSEMFLNPDLCRLKEIN